MLSCYTESLTHDDPKNFLDSKMTNVKVLQTKMKIRVYQHCQMKEIPVFGSFHEESSTL